MTKRANMVEWILLLLAAVATALSGAGVMPPAHNCRFIGVAGTQIPNATVNSSYYTLYYTPLGDSYAYHAVSSEDFYDPGYQWTLMANYTLLYLKPGCPACSYNLLQNPYLIECASADSLK